MSTPTKQATLSNATGEAPYALKNVTETRRKIAEAQKRMGIQTSWNRRACLPKDLHEKSH